MERGLVKRAGVIRDRLLPGACRHRHVRPGVPGPGVATILLGLTFLALEFDWAERMLERAIIWGDKAKERAENSAARAQALSAVAGLAVVAAGVAAVLLWDIPLLPV